MSRSAPFQPAWIGTQCTVTNVVTAPSVVHGTNTRVCHPGQTAIGTAGSSGVFELSW